jgi:hypothetical protein
MDRHPFRPAHIHLIVSLTYCNIPSSNRITPCNQIIPFTHSSTHITSSTPSPLPSSTPSSQNPSSQPPPSSSPTIPPTLPPLSNSFQFPRTTSPIKPTLNPCLTPPSNQVQHPSYKPLTTQIFDRRDPYLENDSVFGVKDSLIVDFVPLKDNPKATLELNFPVILAPQV